MNSFDESSFAGRVHTPYVSVNSASDLVLGAGNHFMVAGTGFIKAVAVAGWEPGDVVMLRFQNNPIVKHDTAGGPGTAPIRLAGRVDFNVSNDDVLTLVYTVSPTTGAGWYEVSRSVN